MDTPQHILNIPEIMEHLGTGPTAFVKELRTITFNGLPTQWI